MVNYNIEKLSRERQSIMGLAILWVVFFHCTYTPIFPLIAKIKSVGNVGVDIFLLLSGIGLYYSVQKLKEAENHWILKFYLKRILRILPATVICLLPWYLYLYRGQAIDFPRFLLDITSLSYWIDGNNRGWYVSLTIVLYFIYPVLFLLITKLKGIGEKKVNKVLYWGVFLILEISIIVVNTIIAKVAPGYFDLVNLALCRVPIFVVGCFLGPIVKEKSNIKGLPLICTIIVVIIAILLLKYKSSLKIYGIWRYFYGILGFCIAIILSEIFCALKKVTIGKWVTKGFDFLGKYTLEIYLIHTQVLSVMNEQIGSNISDALINIVAIMISILLAVVLHEGLVRLMQKTVSDKKVE